MKQIPNCECGGELTPDIHTIDNKRMWDCVSWYCMACFKSDKIVLNIDAYTAGEKFEQIVNDIMDLTSSKEQNQVGWDSKDKDGLKYQIKGTNTYKSTMIKGIKVNSDWDILVFIWTTEDYIPIKIMYTDKETIINRMKNISRTALELSQFENLDVVITEYINENLYTEYRKKYNKYAADISKKSKARKARKAALPICMRYRYSSKLSQIRRNISWQKF